MKLELLIILNHYLVRSYTNSLTKLLDYFEDTYIGRLNRRAHRRIASFHINVWNCHELIQKETFNIQTLLYMYKFSIMALIQC